MKNIIRRKERMQVGIVVLVIIICLVLVKSALIGISSIKATCKPISETSRKSTKVSELEAAEEPQQQIIEESASVVAEETPSEPEPIQESNLGSVERSEPVLAAVGEPEVSEQPESEESLDESEPWIAEDTRYDPTAESTFVADADPKPEPETTEVLDVEVIEKIDTEVVAEMEPEETLDALDLEVIEELQQQIIEEAASVAAEETPSEPKLLEEPNIESVERSEPTLAAAREPEVGEQPEFEKSLEETESWMAEDTPYESTMESTSVADADSKPEPDMIEERYQEVIEETEAQAIEDTDTEVVAEMESEEALVESEPEVVEEPQPQITEESTTVACEEVSSEPELLEQPSIESIESSEPAPIMARQVEERPESEESLDEWEPWTTEDTRYEPTVEPTFADVADPKPEPETIEVPDAEVIEETDAEVVAEMESEEILDALDLEVIEELQQQIIEESASAAAEETSCEPELLEESSIESVERSEPALAAAREPEVSEQPESAENLDEWEPWIAEDTRYEPTVESTSVADTDLEPEPDIIEEPYLEVIEETGAEVFAETEPEETLVAYELEVAEEPQSQIIEESTSVAVEEASSEPELFEEPNIESVERSQPAFVAASEPKVSEQPESEESLGESEPWIAEDARYEATLESTFVVVEDPKPELEMIEVPDAEVIEETDAEVSAEMESEESLVAYEPEAVEEPRQEIVEEHESVFASLQKVFEEPKTKNTEGPTTAPIEASEPEVAEESQPRVSVVEEQTGSVSLRLANIIGGKAGPAVTQEPQAAIGEDAKPDEALETSEPEVVEEPRQRTVGEEKSVFSYLQEILNKLRR